MNQSFYQKFIINKLVVDFELVNTFRTIGAQLPPISYVDHVECILLAKDMASLELPSGDKWKMIEKFGKMEYKLHQ